MLRRDDLGFTDDFFGTTTFIELLVASTKAWSLLSLSFVHSNTFLFRASQASRASVSFLFFATSVMLVVVLAVVRLLLLVLRRLIEILLFFI